MQFEPVMRTDEHHVRKHAEILALGNKKDIGVVFLGDSITRRWEDNIDLWDRYFSRFRPANLGVGQDCLQNIKWRILNGELDGIGAKVLVLLAGTNNLDTNTAGQISLGVGELLEIIRKKLPSTKILVLGLYPRGVDERGTDFSEKIADTNRGLEALCAETGCRFADIGKALLGSDGRVQAALQPDGLHPGYEGFAVLGPLLADLIGQMF